MNSMLKKTILTLLLALPFIVSAQAQVKIGKVDIVGIVNAMPEHAEAQKKFEETAKTFEAEILRLRTEYEDKAKKLDAQYDSIPEEVRTRRVQEIQELGQRIQQYQQDVQQQLQKKNDELMQPIVEKVNVAIKAIGEEGGYTCIFDSVRTEGLLFTGKDCEDLTPKVKARLNIK